MKAHVNISLEEEDHASRAISGRSDPVLTMSTPHPGSRPFILRTSVGESFGGSKYDELTSEDPLPATVKMDSTGLILTRATRLTEVQQETTDDQ
jgi:hypothetical protein